MFAFVRRLNVATAQLVAGAALALAVGLGGVAQAQNRPAAPAQQPAQQPAAQPQPAPRPAAIPQPVPEVFDQWTLRCFQDAKSTQFCRIETIVRESNNRPQLAVTVRPPADPSQPPVATVTPPWGILLARGIDMQVDAQQALRIAVRTCLPSGCVADFALIETINAQWQKGAALKLTMAAASGQPLTIEAPLAGFPKAYARLLEKTKR